MQNVDRPAHVEPLPEPTRASRTRVNVKPPLGVSRPERLDRIVRRPCGCRYLRQLSTVRPPEPLPLIGLPLDPIALLVHRAMMAPTQQGEVGERRGAALSPVAQVVPLCHPHPASREAAAAVPMQERAPDRGRNGPGPRPDLHDAPPFVVAHHYAVRVTGESLRRFRRNARAVLED
jgi:hypothetical protein